MIKTAPLVIASKIYLCPSSFCPLIATKIEFLEIFFESQQIFLISGLNFLKFNFFLSFKSFKTLESNNLIPNFFNIKVN